MTAVSLARAITAASDSCPRGHGAFRYQRDLVTSARASSLSYGLVMPAARSPAPEETVAARRILLTGLAQDAALPDLIGELAPLHPRGNTFPGEVFLRLAADALAWSGVSPADPLPLEGMRERFLPEFSGRGRDRRKLQYAVLAAAALHGGAEPDLLDEVTWWQADDFWQYALLAAVAYVRAAADRAGVPVREACKELAGRSPQPPG
jgi:hypothetical protein